MSRTQTLFTLVFPSMIAGGVLFGSAFGHADSGRDHGDWPSSAATVVAQADPPPVPRSPMPPMPPMPPTPPRHGHGHGINIQMHDGKLQVDGVNDIVERSIKSAQDAIKSSQLPPDVRDRLQKRLDNVRARVEQRLAHLDANDLDQLGDELGKMGDDIGQEMDEFGKEMEKYGDKMSKDATKNFGKNFGKNWAQQWNFGSDDNDHDTDSDHDNDSDQDSDSDDQDDVDAAARDLGDLSLRGPQRAQIQKLRADSDRQVAVAKRQLDQASAALQRQLDNVSASDADLARAIDAVSQQEAAIRKARILAWHGARRILDTAQRKQVEDAARAHKKGPRSN
ncbi:MAG: hypothetical protein ABI467_22920 [Kofleriaceae bacterium]